MTGSRSAARCGWTVRLGWCCPIGSGSDWSAPSPTRRLGRPRCPGEVGKALASARTALVEQAEGRRRSLVADALAGRSAELERTRAYYDALLDTLAQRRASAAPERTAGYAAREEATRSERARRLAEVEEAHRPRTDVRLFRAHLLWAPALVLPVDVQRGPHRYPLELVWMRIGGGFLPLPCPSCGAESALVATKHGVVCRACVPVAAAPPRVLPSEPVVAAAGAASPGPWHGSTAANDPAAVANHPASNGPARVGGAPSARRSPPSPARPRGNASAPKPARPVGEVSRERAADSRALESQSIAFWRAAAEGERRIRQFIADNSSLAALRYLYGSAAPQLALGMAAGEPLTSATAGHLPETAGCVTSGTLETRHHRYLYSLRWRLSGGHWRVGEVLPSSWVHGEVLPRLEWLPPWVRTSLFAPPPPRVNLDPVATRLWETVLPAEGLPLAARCLAAWWAAPGSGADQPAEIAAAALAYEIARRSRTGVTYAQAADRYGVDEPALRKAVLALRPALAATPL